jgi:NADH-quinone oxidoreductase subunit L
MLEILWLIPAIPLASAALLAVFGGRMSKSAVSVIGAGSIGVSALVTAVVAYGFAALPPVERAYTQFLWTWMRVGDFSPAIGLHLDALSLVMTAVVTFVGFLIHVYSTEYMAHSEGYSRFFAYMNLFVASMLVLVLGDNLLLLFLGWEGVGLCSFLLIGFWYQDSANGRAAQKAFIVTRVGDTAFTIALLLLFASLGTLDIQELMQRAQAEWAVGSGVAVAVAALLLGGAVGKSAQLPLQTWLPDAMAGPTPTSALIHAATMVTAGVYLIARTHALFTLAPSVMVAVAVVGALTLLIAGFSAITQTEIKRVLAYSTVSQIGYMFLALGVGAWAPAMFHFYTHAFFKALLFLAAGVVIEALHENDIFKMGGLRRRLPVTFWSFVIGGSALAGLPLVTSGFYSKDLIIWRALSSPLGHPLLWAAGIAGVLVTAIYSYRLIFVVFFGEERGRIGHRPGLAFTVPLIILSVFSIGAGFINLPPALGGEKHFEHFLESAVPPAPDVHAAGVDEHTSELVAAGAFALGLAIAWWFWLRSPASAETLASSGAGRPLHRFLTAGWGFDWLYDRLFVRPFLWLARVSRPDFVDVMYVGIAATAAGANRGLARTQNGHVRWYAAGIAAGAIVFFGIVLLT